MTRGFFITGTDTGVGKTFVTTHLARRARHHQHDVFAFKPIETGCEGSLGDDQRLLVEAAGGWQLGELAGVYQFRLPAAPLVAAVAESRAIDLDHIEDVFRHGVQPGRFALVEGAGGWRVPITSTVDMGALAKRLQLPVLLVARATLGTLNHTMLSAEAIQRDGCALAGVILSRLPTDDVTLISSNLAELRRHLAPVVLLEGDPSALDRFVR